MSQRRRRRGRSTKKAPSASESFWGESKKRNTPKPIRPTPDPAALLRSLGEPPLAPATAAQHLAVVYEEAVRAATALAAANGLLAEDDDAPVS